MKMTAFAALATLAAAGTVLAEAHMAVSLQALDTDGDGMVSGAEFSEGTRGAGLYARYDTDGDGMVSEAEFDAANLSFYDTDGDGMISEAEFEGVAADFGPGGRYMMNDG